jgi:pimeloyl-ACP methyl ester carboxylesterase
MTQQTSLAISRFGDTASHEPPVLFIHGFLSRAESDWPHEHWSAPLAARGRGAIAPDLPAHGASGPVDDARSVTVTSLVEALAGLLAGPSDVVGYSLGARLAWSLAARYPDRVRRLVLGGLSPGDPFAALDVPAAREFAETGAEPSDPMTAMISGMVVGAGGDASSRINLMEGLGSEAFDPEAEAPPMSALFLAGDADPMTADLDKLVHARGDTLMRVPGDHATALHSPQFRDAILAHLD